ncbi:MAG: hypothetical protein ACFB9N_03325 [Geitlerinemataceae cyanobacterium]
MESGRFPSPDRPLGGGSQLLGAILAACTLGIPIAVVLAFSSPPSSLLDESTSTRVEVTTTSNLEAWGISPKTK